MIDYLQQEKERLEKIHAQTAHEHHIVEFRQMCAQMIEDALRQHDQQVQVDVQTTLNGKPCTMNGLVADVKKQIMSTL